MKILIALIVCTASLFLLKWLSLLIKFLVKRRSKLKFLNRLFPLIELFVGLGILFWVMDYLFSTKSYYPVLIFGAVIIFMAFFSWYFLKDLIAGIIFRAQNSFQEGALIQLGDISGKILDMGSTYILIETQQGRTIKVPYSRLTSEIISEQAQQDMNEDSIIQFEVSKKNYDAPPLEDIRDAVMHSPWRLLSQEPHVKLLEEHEESYEVEIHVKTRTIKHQQHLLTSLRQKFQA